MRCFLSVPFFFHEIHLKPSFARYWSHRFFVTMHYPTNPPAMIRMFSFTNFHTTCVIIRIFTFYEAIVVCGLPNSDWHLSVILLLLIVVFSSPWCWNDGQTNISIRFARKIIHPQAHRKSNSSVDRPSRLALYPRCWTAFCPVRNLGTFGGCNMCLLYRLVRNFCMGSKLSL